LGSDETVRNYVDGKNEPIEEEPKDNSPKDLFGEALPPKQGRLF
jgi:hypothetical protein